jgi:hypothetical protein
MGFTELLWERKRLVIFGRKELKRGVFLIDEHN